jgi:hypothetical protein
MSIIIPGEFTMVFQLKYTTATGRRSGGEGSRSPVPTCRRVRGARLVSGQQEERDARGCVCNLKARTGSVSEKLTGLGLDQPVSRRELSHPRLPTARLFCFDDESGR